MKLEQTIQLLYDMWGEDILTRKHALNTLFLLEGSGGEWINGELCNTCHKILSTQQDIDEITDMVNNFINKGK